MPAKSLVVWLAAVVAGLASASPSNGKQECGDASWYSLPGQKTASGEPMDPNAMTAAHKTLPLGSVVTVTNRLDGKSVTVRISDRGPYIKGRIIDLSKGAALRIGGVDRGITPVCISSR